MPLQLWDAFKLEYGTKRYRSGILDVPSWTAFAKASEEAQYGKKSKSGYNGMGRRDLVTLHFLFSKGTETCVRHICLEHFCRSQDTLPAWSWIFYHTSLWLYMLKAEQYLCQESKLMLHIAAWVCISVQHPAYEGLEFGGGNSWKS